VRQGPVSQGTERVTIAVLARLLCDSRAEAMGGSYAKEPCDVCRRQAVLILDRLDKAGVRAPGGEDPSPKKTK